MEGFGFCETGFNDDADHIETVTVGFCDSGDLITRVFENTILIDGPDEIFRHLEPVDHLVGPFADPGIGRETPLADTPAASLASDNVSCGRAGAGNDVPDPVVFLGSRIDVDWPQ